MPRSTPRVSADRPAWRPARRATLVLATTVAAASCGGGDPKGTRGGDGAAATGGTIVVAMGAQPSTLMPPLAGNSQSNSVIDQIFDRLAELGDSLNVVGDGGFRPRLARRWTWAPDSLSIAFVLDSTARWHDGHPVRADDVRFTFDVYTDPEVAAASAPLLSNIDSVTAQDSSTAVVWFKRRTSQQFFDATYHMKILPRHLLESAPRARLAATPFARAPIGTGRFRFQTWEAGQRVEIVADRDNYRGRAIPDRVVWSVAPTFAAAALKLTSGEADFLETLLPESIRELAGKPSLVTAPYPSLLYGFVQFNLRAADGSARPHPIFGDRETRRALTMAVDRERVVANVFDSLASVAAGPFPRVLFPDWRSLRQIPHDLPRARALLDSLGWRDADGDGVRERGGTPLAFTVLAPTSSASRRRLAVLFQDQMRAAGARVTVDEIDVNTLSERHRQRRFDATMNTWQTDPSPSGMRQTWGTLGSRASGGSNYGSYESRAFDVALDSALAARDASRARAYWKTAFQTIIDDAPAIWLFELRSIAGVHRRIRLAPLRADAWWANLADWSIPVTERIGRDRVQLR